MPGMDSGGSWRRCWGRLTPSNRGGCRRGARELPGLAHLGAAAGLSGGGRRARGRRLAESASPHRRPRSRLGAGGEQGGPRGERRREKKGSKISQCLLGTRLRGGLGLRSETPPRLRPPRRPRGKVPPASSSPRLRGASPRSLPAAWGAPGCGAPRWGCPRGWGAGGASVGPPLPVGHRGGGTFGVSPCWGCTSGGTPLRASPGGMEECGDGGGLGHGCGGVPGSVPPR